MNTLDERSLKPKTGEPHTSASDIDSLLAELGYRSPAEASRPAPKPEAETPKAPTRPQKASEPPAAPRRKLPRAITDAAVPPEPKPLRELPLPRFQPEAEPLLDVPIAEERRKPRQKPAERQPSQNRFIRRLETALEEDVDEIEMLTALPSLHDGKPMSLTKAQRRRKRLYTLLGGCCALIMLVGLYTVLTHAWHTASGFVSNDRQKQKFADYIEPLVIMDIEDFSSTTELDGSQVLTAAIWDFIMHGDFSKYDQTMDVVTVPAIDIDKHVTKLFGSGLTYTHQTIGIGSIRFYYSDDIKSYNIPVSPAFFSYKPEIETITKQDTTYTLRVRYCADTPAWQQQDAIMLESEKIVEYVVTEGNNQYQILSVKNITGA